MSAIKIKSKFFDRFSDDEFYHFCQENRDIRIERNHKQEIIFMPPTGGSTGKYELAIGAQLYLWNQQSGLGVAFGPSTGFKLPDSSILSPDAAWIPASKWDALSQDEKEKFLPLCPDFLIEIRSPSDHLEPLKRKMGRWIRNGAQIAVLIDLHNRKVLVYRPDEPVQSVGFEQALSFEDLLPGLKLDLSVFR